MRCLWALWELFLRCACGEEEKKGKKIFVSLDMYHSVGMVVLPSFTSAGMTISFMWYFNIFHSAKSRSCWWGKFWRACRNKSWIKDGENSKKREGVLKPQVDVFLQSREILEQQISHGCNLMLRGGKLLDRDFFGCHFIQHCLSTNNFWFEVTEIDSRMLKRFWQVVKNRKHML